jgi:septal ring factor EnvC (AmiA/AmiB activator)
VETRQPKGRTVDRRLWRAVRTALLVVVLAGAPVALGADPQGPSGMRSEAEIRNDLQAAHASQARLSAQVADRQRAVTELGARQVELEGEIARTAAALESINADLTAVRAQIVDITARIEQVEAEYARLGVKLVPLYAQVA